MLLSKQQQYALDVLRRLGCVRENQLEALLKARFFPPEKAVPALSLIHISDELNFALCFSPWTFPVKSARYPAPGCLDFQVFPHMPGAIRKTGNLTSTGGHPFL